MRRRNFSLANTIGAILTLAAVSAGGGFLAGVVVGFLYRCAKSGFDLFN